ncbi:MAG: hypothetical protein ACOYVJ_02995 [Nitrospirota bacterium]
MEKKTAHKNPCPDCTFCQYCPNTRCNMCRAPQNKKRVKEKKPKTHKPLFLKF